jgi:hypothetical protein
MAAAADAVHAVAAWIDGRLDLAVNGAISSNLRQMSLEAQMQMLSAPELVKPAYHEILRPLVEQLERGKAEQLFTDITPELEAHSIQSVVWSTIERLWSTTDCDFDELRAHAQQFCLRGLGVAPTAIRAVLSGSKRPRDASKPRASRTTRTKR